MSDKEIIINKLLHNPLHPINMSAIYRYGSYVYGTVNKQSDVDIICVSLAMDDPFIQYSDGAFNCTAFSEKEFLSRLNDHDITMIECISLPNKMIIKEKKNYAEHFELDLYKLRHAVSAKASNSFVKAKKKFIVPEDKNIYVGKKSLFHSLRLPMFGSQVAKHGRIVDFAEANHYWPEILNNPSENWEVYKKRYKPIFNNIMSEFRKVAPK